MNRYAVCGARSGGWMASYRFDGKRHCHMWFRYWKPLRCHEPKMLESLWRSLSLTRELCVVQEVDEADVSGGWCFGFGPPVGDHWTRIQHAEQFPSEQWVCCNLFWASYQRLHNVGFAGGCPDRNLDFEDQGRGFLRYLG